jgi:hypothetical protein
VDERFGAGNPVTDNVTRVDQEQRLSATPNGQTHEEACQHPSDEDREHGHKGKGPPCRHIKSVGEGPEGDDSAVNDIRDDQQWSSLMCE